MRSVGRKALKRKLSGYARLVQGELEADRRDRWPISRNRTKDLALASYDDRLTAAARKLGIALYPLRSR